jgi:hypothetical protein
MGRLTGELKYREGLKQAQDKSGERDGTAEVARHASISTFGSRLQRSNLQRIDKRRLPHGNGDSRCLEGKPVRLFLNEPEPLLVFRTVVGQGSGLVI